MKKIERYLVLFLLAVVLGNTWFMNFTPVTVEAAEEVSQEEIIKLKGMSVVENIDLDNVVPGTSFTVRLTAEAPENMGIQSVLLSFGNSEIEEYPGYLVEFSDNIWYPSVEAQRDIEININSYARNGVYILTGMTFITTDNMAYNYTHKFGTQFLELKKEGEVEVLDTITYGGELDYTITGSENIDTDFPEVTGIRLMSDPIVSSGENAVFELDYKEEGTSIKKVLIEYSQVGVSQDDAPFVLIFRQDNMPEGKYTGEGTLELSAPCTMPNEYELYSISIEDYAGHQRYYTREEGTDYFVSYQGGKECRVEPDVENISVQYAKYNVPKISGIKVENGVDKDNLSPGDSFDVSLEIYNDTTEDININPEDYIIWWDLSNGDERSAQGNGESFTLKKGEDADVHFTIDIDSDTEDLQWKFYALAWGDYNTTGILAWPEGAELVSYYGNTSIIDIIPYAGELDFSVTDSLDDVMRGDITGDRSVDIEDLSLMLQVVNERVPLSELSAAQIEAGDIVQSSDEAAGTIDLGDLAKLLQYVNERITEL